MAAQQPSRVTGACRVVVADDADELRLLVRTLLELDGRATIVAEADNGRSAVQRCAETQPDVLLLDVSMPVMDGIEAIPLVLAASPATRIVMLSGFATDEMKRRALAAGAVDFVEKGASVEEIANAVAAAYALAPR